MVVKSESLRDVTASRKVAGREWPPAVLYVPPGMALAFSGAEVGGAGDRLEGGVTGKGVGAKVVYFGGEEGSGKLGEVVGGDVEDWGEAISATRGAWDSSSRFWTIENVNGLCLLSLVVLAPLFNANSITQALLILLQGADAEDSSWRGSVELLIANPVGRKMLRVMIIIMDFDISAYKLATTDL
jgi:hypothetical protein